MFIKIKPCRKDDGAPHSTKNFECARYDKVVYEIGSQKDMDDFWEARCGVRIEGALHSDKDFLGRFNVTIVSFFERLCDLDPSNSAVVIGQYSLFVTNDHGATVDRVSN